jgi:hypothetical protein
MVSWPAWSEAVSGDAEGLDVGEGGEIGWGGRAQEEDGWDAVRG